MNFGAFAGGATDGYLSQSDNMRKQADEKRKQDEADRQEVDRKLDDEVNKQTAGYMKQRLGVISSPAAQEKQAVPAVVIENPAAQGLSLPTTRPEPATFADSSVKPSAPQSIIAANGINAASALRQGIAKPEPVASPEAQKVRQPDINDMVDVAQHRASLYLQKGNYAKAIDAHKDYMAFAAEKLKGEETQRSRMAKNMAAGIMAGDYSGLGAFYDTLPDGNKLQSVTPNKDGTITVVVASKDGKEKPPVTFKNGEHLANAVVSLVDTNTALQYMDRSGKAEIEAAKTKFDQEHKTDTLAETRDYHQGVINVAKNRAANSGGLTLPQRRTNEEIDAARQYVAGLGQDEIRRRTQQYSTTGRENPDYDPMLASRVRQANHRKYGDDPDFADIANPEADAMQDIGERFALDPVMKGRRIGNKTPQGVEVFDANGKLIGHYN